jgi:hypothetical protein
MRKRGGVREVVDRDEVDVLVGERGAHDVAPDAAEPVDANFDGHPYPPADRKNSDKGGSRTDIRQR